MSAQFFGSNRKISDQVISVNPWQLTQLNDPNIRFVKVRHNGKEAVERNWQTWKNYSFFSSEIRDWINNGGNYGLTSPLGFFCAVDADTPDIQDALRQNLPETLRYSTGKEGHFQDLYFVSDGPIGCIPLEGGAYIKGRGGYALGPGSVHPNGMIYGSRELRNIPIAVVSKKSLLEALSPFVVGSEEYAHKAETYNLRSTGQILTVLEKYAVDVSQFKHSGSWLRGSHPVHGSETGSNFVVNPETDTWHCFRHGTGGGPISLIAVLEHLVDCENVGKVE